jgi:hypothetical protein
MVMVVFLGSVDINNDPNGSLRTVILITIIIGLATLALMSYAFVPSEIADRFPDANYIEQLVRMYGKLGKILNEVGTNEAYDYSYYPLFETFLLTLSKISAIPHVLILRFFSIFAITIFFVIWLSIYKRLLKYSDALIALIIALTSFHFIVFYIRPLHPTYALIFTSMLLFIWMLESRSIYKYNLSVISIIFIIAIVLSHNTTGLLISLLLLITLLIISLSKILFHRFRILYKISDLVQKLAGERRKIFYITMGLLAIYLTYNLYVAIIFFEKGILNAVVTYLNIILSRETIPLEIILGFGKGVKINIIGSSELAIHIYIMKYRMGYISLLLYLLLSGIFILKHLLGISSQDRDNKGDNIHYIFDLLALSSAIIILFGLLTWSQTFARDYYWRFYTFYFLFSAPTFIHALSRSPIKYIIKAIFIYIILLNSMLWMPNPSLGIDMPYELSDPRAGMYQAIALSMFLRENYYNIYIIGTRYVFNVIGPLSDKWVTSVMYSEDSFLNIRMKDVPIAMSTIENTLIGLSDQYIYKNSIIYMSDQFLTLLKN